MFCAKVMVLVSRPRTRGLGLEFFKKVLTTTLVKTDQKFSTVCEKMSENRRPAGGIF